MPLESDQAMSTAGPIAAHATFDDHLDHGSDAEVGAQRLAGDHQGDGAYLPAICDELRILQKTRQLCIRRQSQCNRSIEQYLVGVMRLSNLTLEQQFKVAAETRKAIEDGSALTTIPVDDFSIVLQSASDRAEWDDRRKRAEKRMRELARQTPGWKFVDSVRGASDLFLAIIIAETTNIDPATGETRHLSHYATHQRVWKRLGLAVIDGERQRLKAGDDALVHAYKPQRRSEIWAMADSMFKNVRGNYRDTYDARRAHTAETHADWTKKHSHDDAMRVMSKQFIADLWREWRRVGVVGSD